jgi:hypothetical protein
LRFQTFVEIQRARYTVPSARFIPDWAYRNVWRVPRKASKENLGGFGCNKILDSGACQFAGNRLIGILEFFPLALHRDVKEGRKDNLAMLPKCVTAKIALCWQAVDKVLQPND